MAYKYKNKQGHLIINMTPEEAKTIGFGIIDNEIYYLIDYQDNSDLSSAKELSYIAVLNDVMNATKIESWCKHHSHYAEDTKYETKAYNNVINKLKEHGIEFKEND